MISLQANLRAGVALAAACLLSVTAEGRVLVHSGGFEAPAYSASFMGTGQLAGQSATTHAGVGVGTWLRQGNGGGSAVVQSSVVSSGSQAVRVDRGANSDDRWAVPVSGFPAERFVSIEWDMYVANSGSSTAFGPFFGIEAYDVNTRIGMLGIDAATSEVLYGDRFNGLVPTPGGEIVLLNEWNAFRIVLDFSTDMYFGFVNNTQVLATPFEFTGADEFTDADITAIAAAGDPESQGLAGTAYFDNYLVRSGIIGDYNSDGSVDAADYTVWRDQDGTSGLLQSADGDANGVVDDDDYVLWSAYYGASQAVENTARAVPEPCAVVLVLGGVFASARTGGRGR